MKKELNLPYGVDPKQFNSELGAVFSRNLPTSTTRKLAGLLAIDYATRLQATPSVREHLSVCINRLSKYLGNMVIVDEDFSSAMTLFTVAISPEKKSDKSKSAKNQEQSQDAVIDAVISVHFAELSGSELATMKEVLKEMLGGKSAKEVFEFVNSDPAIFKGLVQKAAREKQKTKEIVQFVTKHIAEIIQKQQVLKKTKGRIKGLLAKISIGIGVAAVASIGLVTGGLAVPMLLVPMVAISSRVFTAVAEKASNKIIETRPSFKESKQAISTLRSETLAVVKEKAQSRSQTLDKSKIKSQDLSQSLQPTKSKDKQHEKGKSTRSR